MKKTFKLMMAALMLLTATSASAQFSRKENPREPDRFHMGLRAAFTSNSQTWEDAKLNGLSFEADPLPFVAGGLGFDFQVAPIPLFLESGVYYMNKGFTIDQAKYNTNLDEIQHMHEITVPLVVSYHINVAPNCFVQPFFGAFFGVALTDGDMWDIADAEDALFDAGLRLGCGFNFGRLYVNLGYDAGLTKMEVSKKYDFTVSTGTFFATLGFNWAGSR